MTRAAGATVKSAGVCKRFELNKKILIKYKSLKFDVTFYYI